MNNNFKIQFLRNETIFESREEAIKTLQNQISTLQDGSPIIARYRNDKGIQTLQGIVCKDGDTAYVTIQDVYNCQFDDDFTVPNAVGGIAAKTAVSTLKDLTVSEVLDKILFPELQPTITSPSASISFKTGFSANGIYEVGATAPSATTNFTTTFNQGKSVVAGKTDIARAGALDAANSYIYYGGSTANKTLPDKIVLGEMSYNYYAAYAAGSEVVTSYGNVATHDSNNNVIVNPLAAGSVNSGKVTIYGTYPYYCNGASASNSSQESSLPTNVNLNTKLPLQKWTDTLIGAKFASEASTGVRLTFDYPATKKITKVEFMNTISGKWENFPGYTTADTDNKEVQGSSIAYKRLTTNGSLQGALQLRFTVANA